MEGAMVTKLIAEYIKAGKVMELATVENGQPWISTVNYVYDAVGNLYWMSLRNTRHSQAVREDKRVAAGIVLNSEIKRCVHIEGDAFELSGTDAKRAHALYGETYGNKPQRLEEALSGDANLRTYYVLKPRLISLYDEVNFPERQWRQEQEAPLPIE